MTRRKFLQAGGAAAVGSVLGGAGTTRSALAAAQRVRLTERQVPWAGIGSLRVAHVTDLHVGWATHPALLQQAIELTRLARPDLVVLTGDYVNRSLRHLEELRRLLARLPRPCVATLGNHDFYSGAAAVQRLLEQEGVAVLRNSHTRLHVRGEPLTVVGVDDAATGHADADRSFAGVARPAEALTPTHHPDTADAIAAHDGRLILAGHTHGGQVVLPGLTAVTARLLGIRYLAGWYRVGECRLFVNAGIGSASIRRRIGRTAAPEVAVLELVHQEAAATAS